jgi:hypothetical protein
MSTAVLTDRLGDTSLRLGARITGVFYLLTKPASAPTAAPSRGW